MPVAVTVKVGRVTSTTKASLVAAIVLFEGSLAPLKESVTLWVAPATYQTSVDAILAVPVHWVAETQVGFARLTVFPGVPNVAVMALVVSMFLLKSTVKVALPMGTTSGGLTVMEVTSGVAASQVKSLV